MNRRDLIVAGFGCAMTAIIGCSDGAPPAVDADAEAKAKVASFDRLVEELAKNPDSLDAAAAMEVYRNHIVDVNKNRAEAQAIVDAYNAKVKGKIRGTLAQDVQNDVLPLEAQLKRAE